MQSIRYIVTGKVQKVGFRHYFARLAKSYKLKGYIKNLPNGDVEILLQKPSVEMKKLLEELTLDQPQIFIHSFTEEKINFTEFKDFLIC